MAEHRQGHIGKSNGGRRDTQGPPNRQPSGPFQKSVGRPENQWIDDGDAQCSTYGENGPQPAAPQRHRGYGKPRTPKNASPSIGIVDGIDRHLKILSLPGNGQTRQFVQMEEEMCTLSAMQTFQCMLLCTGPLLFMVWPCLNIAGSHPCP